MRRGLVIIDHGSRHDGANDLVRRVAEQVRARRPDWRVEHAHMEISSPTLADAVQACVTAGAEEIVVHPYFLGRGRHTSESIPALVEAVSALHPDVAIRVTAPLGPHDTLVDLVLERVDLSVE